MKQGQAYPITGRLIDPRDVDTVQAELQRDGYSISDEPVCVGGILIGFLVCRMEFGVAEDLIFFDVRED